MGTKAYLNEGQRYNLGDGLEIVPRSPADEPNTATVEFVINDMQALYLRESPTHTLLEILGARMYTADPEATVTNFLCDLGIFLCTGRRNPDGGCFMVGSFQIPQGDLNKLTRVAITAAEDQGFDYKNRSPYFQEFIATCETIQ